MNNDLDKPNGFITKERQFLSSEPKNTPQESPVNHLQAFAEDDIEVNELFVGSFPDWNLLPQTGFVRRTKRR